MTWACEGDGCDHSGTWPSPRTARIWCSACTGFCSELSPCVRGELAQLRAAVGTVVAAYTHWRSMTFNAYLGPLGEQAQQATMRALDQLTQHAQGQP